MKIVSKFFKLTLLNLIFFKQVFPEESIVLKLDPEFKKSAMVRIEDETGEKISHLKHLTANASVDIVPPENNRCYITELKFIKEERSNIDEFTDEPRRLGPLQAGKSYVLSKKSKKKKYKKAMTSSAWPDVVILPQEN